MVYFLAGDLGGTKTILALYAATDDGYVLLREQRFANSAYGDFSGIIAEFLHGSGQRPQAAAFGVAGPVVGGRVGMTNLGWLIDPDLLQEQFRFAEVLVLNDLVA